MLFCFDLIGVATRQSKQDVLSRVALSYLDCPLFWLQDRGKTKNSPKQNISRVFFHLVLNILYGMSRM